MTATAKQELRKQHELVLKLGRRAPACVDDIGIVRLKRAAQYVISKEPRDPEKEQMRREIASLHSAVNQLTKFIQQNQIRQAPAISFLDEMMASLEVKPDAVRATEPSEFSQSFVDALLSED